MTGGLAKSGAKNGSNAASSTCTVRSMGSKIPASLKNVATSGQAKVITSGQSMKHPINGQLMDVTAMGSLKSAAVKVRQEMSKQISESESSDDYSDVPVPDGLIRCVYCKRNFAEERVEKHQVICQKTKTKKRKIYDASKKRVQVRIIENKSQYSGHFAFLFSSGHRSGDLLEEANNFCSSNPQGSTQAKQLEIEARRLHQNDSSSQGNASSSRQRRKVVRFAAAATKRKSRLC